LGDKNLFLLDTKSLQRKHKIPISSIPEIVLTKGKDGLALIKIPLEMKKDKGDLILDIPHIIEFATWFVSTSKQNNIKIIDAES
jgi:myosin I